jgi:putative Holliday junction resolvase
MRAMGLDVGTKTIGVALSDELYLTAQALVTLSRAGMKRDLAELERLAKEHEVNHWVVGLPLNMNGTEGDRAKDSRKLGDALKDVTTLPVDYWDERLSTVEAERILLQADVSRKKRKLVIDKLAAAVILQGWLDSRPKETE